MSASCLTTTQNLSCLLLLLYYSASWNNRMILFKKLIGLYCQFVIIGLYCQFVIIGLYCQFVIIGLYCQIVIIGLYCQFVIIGLYCQFVITGLYCQFVLQMSACTVHLSPHARIVHQSHNGRTGLRQNTNFPVGPSKCKFSASFLVLVCLGCKLVSSETKSVWIQTQMYIILWLFVDCKQVGFVCNINF